MSRPDYFSSAKVHGVRYEDGGRDARNPSQEAIREIVDLHDSASDSIDCLVSVGCGNPQIPFNGLQNKQIERDEQASLTLTRAASHHHGRDSRAAREQSAADGCHKMHRVARSQVHELNGAYDRLDPFSDLWDLSDKQLNSKNKNEQNSVLEMEVCKTLQSEDMQRKLSACAQRLVVKRLGKDTKVNVESSN